MAVDRSNVTEGREDYSRFVVHLTRTDKADFTNGSTARDNFVSIGQGKSDSSVQTSLPSRGGSTGDQRRGGVRSSSRALQRYLLTSFTSWFSQSKGGP